MITYSLVFLLRIFGLVRLTRSFFLAMGRGACDGFDLTVLNPSDKRGNDTYVSLILRVTRWGLFLHE